MSLLVRGSKTLKKRGLLITAVFMALLGGVYLVSTYASSDPVVTDEVEGEFIHLIEDDFENHRETEVYKIKDRAGNYWRLDLSGRKVDIRTGAKVRVAGSHKRSDKRNLAVPAASQVQVVQPAPPTPETSTAPTDESSKVLAARAVKLASIIVNFVVTDGSTAIKQGSPLMTVAQGNEKYTTSPGSVRNYYLQSSEGQIDVATTVFEPVTIRVSGTNASTCAYNQWADLADAAAQSAGINLSGFTHVQYQLALMDTALCNWAGIGYMNGRRSWMRNASGTAVFEITQPGAAAHELGHNLGMQHSNSLKCTDAAGLPVAYSATCTTASYGDPFDAMGSQPPTRLLTSLHRARQGVLPSSSVATATASGNYTLGSTNVATATAGIQSLRFAAGAATFELSYRSPSGSIDNFAATDPAVNGVHIRKLPATPDGSTGDSQLIDMVPMTSTTNDAPLVKGAFYDPNSKTSVTLVSRTATTITVKLALGGAAVAPAVPIVSGISPTSFSKGQIVTVTGSGFTSNTGITPLVGGVAASKFAVISNTELQFLAPAHSNGTVAVGVQMPWGAKSATVNGTYVTAVPITVRGRITNSLTGAGMGGISVQIACVTAGTGPAVTTATDGTYFFTVLPGDQYCVWPNKNLPTGAVVKPTNNRPENPSWRYYWYQQAGLNAYQSPLYLNETAYSADLAADTGLDFTVDVPGTATPTPTPTATPVVKPGDLNGDTKVNVFDLSKLLSDWGKSGSVADLNRDGTVNVFDLSILLSGWSP